MTDVVLSADAWTALLATTRRTKQRADAFAALLPAGGSLKLYDGETLLRTITVGAWTVGTVRSDGKYPLVPGAFTDGASGSGTPDLAVFCDDVGDEVCRMPAGVGSGVFQLSAPLVASTAIGPGSFVLMIDSDDRPPDVPPPSDPPPAGSTWATVALSDMRIPGYTGTYTTSYAANDERTLGRRANGGLSSQYLRACLVQGRYASPDAFNSAINPDYNEVSWITNTTVLTQEWPRMTHWNQLYLGEDFGLEHEQGWANNTRVMSWDHQVWIKRRSTGLWFRARLNDSMSGEGWSPNFKNYGGNAASIYVDIRDEPYGFKSVRPVYDSEMTGVPGYTNEPTGSGYWIFHGYSGVFAIDGRDIADVVVSQKASLVLHDTGGTDDRDKAHYLFAVGADYYPPSGGPYLYPSVGCSRHKRIVAQWPNWQFLVMHTMSLSQFAASNGYPSYFNDLVEGS